ncbi:hypothetical protein Ndes2526B_g02871 [Nannochloris sp. 'desiccata']
MPTELDPVMDLARRVAELEEILSREEVKVQSEADPLSILSRFDLLQTALEQQQHAFQDFVRAHTAQKSDNLGQYISSVPESPVPVVKQSPKDNLLDAATQTPLAQVPSVPPPPPPVRVRPLDPLPKGPSPLRRSGSADVGQNRSSTHFKDAPVSQPSSFWRNPTVLGTPPSAHKIEQRTPCPAKLKRVKETPRTVQAWAPTNDVGLRERRAAFAALQSTAPQSKASKRTSLAITAAQREIVRAAARAKEEANREREEKDGVRAWIVFVLLVIGGIGATVLGIMAMTMKAESVAQGI